MKNVIVVLLAALLAMSVSASANTLTQSNFLTAYSGIACPEEGNVEQWAVNCAAVIGEDNDITQTNDLNGYGINIDQYAKNNVIVCGSGNTVVQDNFAEAMGLNSVNGSNVEQDQKNLLCIIGDDNDVSQANEAYAYNGADVDFDAWIYQTEKNIGVVLGSGSSLTQLNLLNATMDKDLIVDPVINQTAKNLGFVVGDDDFSCPDEEWSNETLSINWPDYCCDCPEICVCECPEWMGDFTCNNMEDNACPEGQVPPDDDDNCPK